MTTKTGTPERDHLLHEWRAKPAPPICVEVSEAVTVAEVRKSGGRQISIKGQCPYCFGDFTLIHSLKLIPSVTTRPTGQGASAIDVVVECRCAHKHPSAPDNTTGCGQHWVIEVRSS